MSVELIHRPYGDRHPYEHAADERVPRHPHAGDAVQLRVLTRPIQAIKNVRVTFWDEAQPEQRHSADLTFSESVSDDVAFTEDGHLSEAAARAGLIFGVDGWHGELPAFAGGVRVGYQFSAETETDPITSLVFSYTMRRTVALDTVTAVRRCADGVRLWLVNSAENISGYLDLHVAADGHLLVTVGIGEKSADVTSVDASPATFGATAIAVTTQPDPFNITISHNDEPRLTLVSPPVLTIGEDIESIALTFDSPQDEAFYGFGERFNALDQRGQQLDVRVYEQYKNHGKKTYMPMPLFVSSAGYAVHIQSLRYSQFDLAHSDPTRWTLQTELGSDRHIALDLLLDDRANLLDLAGRLTALTGRPIMPPDWAFGLWMSGNEWNSQARVEEMTRQHQLHDIPAAVIVLEAWSDENTFYIWNDATYTPKAGGETFSYADFDFPSDGLWPDPKGMIDRLHAQGLRVLLWQIPVLKENEDDHTQLVNDKAHMLEQGYCVHQSDGSPYKIRPFWFHDGLLMDFTHKDGREWWMQKRAYLLDELGIDGFKTDGGEHIWGRDLHFADGRGADEVWNEYPNLYAGTYFNFARRYKPDAITFSRAGYTGAQAFPCHWAGDENSTWEAFRHSILAGLNASVSGVPFWGWDFAGFSGEIPSAELYLRATAMAAFCPIMQYHAEYNYHRQPSNDRTPWNIHERTGDERVLPTFRAFVKLREKLMPYILREAEATAETGVPLMRPLSLAFPTDPHCREFPYQYLFGSSLLVAPVVEKGVTQQAVYLPAGEWTDFWTGEHVEGSQTINYSVVETQIPVFIYRNAESFLLPLIK